MAAAVGAVPKALGIYWPTFTRDDPSRNEEPLLSWSIVLDLTSGPDLDLSGRHEAEIYPVKVGSGLACPLCAHCCGFEAPSPRSDQEPHARSWQV